MLAVLSCIALHATDLDRYVYAERSDGRGWMQRVNKPSMQKVADRGGLP